MPIVMNYTDKEQLKEELREYANMLVEIESRFEQYNEIYRYLNLAGKDGNRDNTIADGPYIGASASF